MSTMLRTFTFWTGAVFWTIIVSFPAIAVGYLNSGRKIASWLCRLYTRGLLFLADSAVRVEGGSKVDLNSPRIYVSNHRSYFDVVALQAVLPGEARFVAKKSLQYIPFLGQAMAAIETGIPIIPVAVSGSSDIMPAGGFRVVPGSIKVRVGDPIDTSAMRIEDRDKLLEAARNEILNLLALDNTEGERVAA